MRSALVLALSLAAATLGPVTAVAEETPADFDKDGVPDSEDDCPTAPGPKESAGCKKDLRAAKPSPSPSGVPEVAKLEADHLVLQQVRVADSQLSGPPASAAVISGRG